MSTNKLDSVMPSQNELGQTGDAVMHAIGGLDEASEKLEFNNVTEETDRKKSESG